MAAEVRSSKGNSFILNSTQETDFSYYNWCAAYPTAPAIWTAVSLICFLLGFPASLLVLHEILQRQRQRSSSDVFMVALSVLDLIFTAQIPISVCNFMLWHIEDLEVFTDFLYSLNLLGRPLFMACICWDCYVAVVYPIVYKTSQTLVVVKKAITVVILLAVGVCASALRVTTWLITTAFTVFLLTVVLAVIAFCDFSIIQALKKTDPSENYNIHPRKKQALHTISNSLIMTFVVYLPPVVIFSFRKLFPLTETELYCRLDFLGFCFNTARCVIMPLLHLGTVGKLDILKNFWKKRSV
ncbi:hydroxycarboxylic acid receptor 2-like [Silurus asotus]|uniref:Hydroxycarboxylic acid receptor 2-like n=1 Tax=Silurus asotus TaxID=30991 RepID=A0AAD5FQI8_SILAS|nr:hydroxycarboxylic acid receptor 2-like [Silurus asotus]